MQWILSFGIPHYSHSNTISDTDLVLLGLEPVILLSKDNGKITLRLEEKKGSVLISVADNGIGIPVKYHDSLFKKFTKARIKGLMGEPSTGLGMSIIKTIEERHDGKFGLIAKKIKALPSLLCCLKNTYMDSPITEDW